jgi:hypothetical protein
MNLIDLLEQHGVDNHPPGHPLSVEVTGAMN